MQPGAQSVELVERMPFSRPEHPGRAVGSGPGVAFGRPGRRDALQAQIHGAGLGRGDVEKVRILPGANRRTGRLEGVVEHLGERSPTHD
jgi:hypothetical protein